MDYLVCGLVLIMGYFIGNIETAVLVSRMAYGDDIRKHGSGNAGTTNMLRVFGMKPGMLTFIGDFLKGILSVIIGRLICGWLCGDAIILGADMATWAAICAAWEPCWVTIFQYSSALRVEKAPPPPWE